MQSLNGILAFVRTAELLSFVKAGRAIGISASAVGKNVARLEASLNVRLFQRHTRKVSLTDEGQLFYERCRPILDDLEDAQAMLSHVAQTPRGRLRISLPTIGYRLVMPLMAEFRDTYPEIELDMDFSDHLVDLVDDRFDVLVRSGGLTDSKPMSRQLGPFQFVLCASPAYLARKGWSRTPAELTSHDCLLYRFVTTGKVMPWDLAEGASPRSIVPPAAMTLNNMEAILMAAQNGLGIAYMPDFLVRESMAAGSLQTLLDGWTTDGGQFWAQWRPSRHLSPKIRVFVDFLSEHLSRRHLSQATAGQSARGTAAGRALQGEG
ncbi:LysR family transcriptional regulator [Pseudomonas sp. UBA6562]|uniref:LysR family transcriptional regulator n=1 Tax=Pseudomonas sp. UBA6562 TaxID=1947332 RepID=UPI0025F7DF5B|nr:LysR family transcriptional regulator [Pseudomonas sp. UBA6562]